MTEQRYIDIEDTVLVGLLNAPNSGETPFKVDPEIFTTTFKKRIASHINSLIDEGTPEMALFNIENMVDNTPPLQQEWNNINSSASKFTFPLPVSTSKRYYDGIVMEYTKNMVKDL